MTDTLLPGPLRTHTHNNYYHPTFTNTLPSAHSHTYLIHSVTRRFSLPLLQAGKLLLLLLHLLSVSVEHILFSTSVTVCEISHLNVSDLSLVSLNMPLMTKSQGNHVCRFWKTSSVSFLNLSLWSWGPWQSMLRSLGVCVCKIEAG